MIVGIILGKDVLPAPSLFGAAMMTVTMLIHFMLAIIYGLIGAWIVSGLRHNRAAIVGAVFGLGIYAVNFYVIAPVLFPLFVDARNGLTIANHLVFGAVIGACYVRLGARHERSRSGIFA